MRMDSSFVLVGWVCACMRLCAWLVARSHPAQQSACTTYTIQIHRHSHESVHTQDYSLTPSHARTAITCHENDPDMVQLDQKTHS